MKLNGDSCIAFIVVGEKVTLRNLKFDQSDCTVKEGYEYHQIPVVCTSSSCAESRFENLELLTDQKSPLIGLLGATGVDGREEVKGSEVDVGVQ